MFTVFRLPPAVLPIGLCNPRSSDLESTVADIAALVVANPLLQ